MSELQDTLFGDGPVPTRAHPNDIVVCSDDTECKQRDALVDCRGGFHSDDEDRLEANVAIVQEILDGIDKWAFEYCTENTDYADGYFCCIDEGCYNWAESIAQWIYDRHDGYDEVADELGQAIRLEIDAGFDCEPEYDANEYAGYSGDGLCLDSFDIGEHEEQVDISCYDELQDLHDAGELDDVLDDVNCDVTVCRSRRREKNEKTGHYEYVGRETYMPYAHSVDHPTFEVYCSPGGQWRFVIPAERMEELFHEAVAVLNGCED